jgi:hypothetical protein
VTITLEQMLTMKSAELHGIMQRGEPLDVDALADTTYTGIDLSLPDFVHRLLWKSFRKTFHRDPVTGRLRGWNVKVEQTGWDTPPAPKRDAKGRALTFGHYEVRSAAGVRFARGWQGGHYLDYRVAGNGVLDFPANAGFCPLVSVNAGSSELLLGWEIFNVAGLRIPLADYWVLKREGPLDPKDIVGRPDGSVPAQLTGPDSR